MAPTVLEAANLPEPKSVNGVVQAPIEGVSMVYTFDQADAKSTHKTQYFEIMGNRAIYHDGWFAGTIHRAPWEKTPRRKLQEDIWELYDTRNDFSLANDLAASNPAKLKELQDLFMKEATKYRVLPIDDRVLERVNAATAGRPDLMGDRTSLTLSEGMVGMSENVFINIKNRSFSINADVRDSGGWSEWRDPCPGWPVRRLEPVSEGWQTDVLLQLPGAAGIQGLSPGCAGGGQGHRPDELRL